MGGSIWADPPSFKGRIGIGSDFGITLLPPAHLHAPEHIPGITGGFRLFYGITNTIGVEAAVHGMNYRDYTPLVTVQPETEDAEPSIVEGDEVKKLQQQYLSAGMVYKLDLYRLTPGFSAGFTRIRTGARSVNGGASVFDYQLYAAIAADYRITRYFWAGIQIRKHLALSENAPYQGPTSFLLRFSMVWRIKQLLHLKD